jgi:hypothetical protein
MIFDFGDRRLAASRGDGIGGAGLLPGTRNSPPQSQRRTVPAAAASSLWRRPQCGHSTVILIPLPPLSLRGALRCG